MIATSSQTTRREQLLEFSMHPPKGWIRKIRNQLEITGPQLAAKLGVTKQRISALEKAEVNGSASIKTMQQAAEALGCEFIYTLVPKGTYEEPPTEVELETAPPLPFPDAAELREAISELCHRFHITDLGLYGPALLDEPDIDITVNLYADFEEEKVPPRLVIEVIEGEFQKIFGRKSLIATFLQLDDLELVDAISSNLKMIYAT